LKWHFICPANALIRHVDHFRVLRDTGEIHRQG
jgi:hypothetical protein